MCTVRGVNVEGGDKKPAVWSALLLRTHFRSCIEELHSFV